MAESGRIRGRIVSLMIEASMVVFAVLVALALEEWREEQRLIEFADRAHVSVMAEVEANLQELDDARDDLLTVQGILAEVLETGDLAIMEGDLELILPEVSQAAWEVAQGSEAAPYFEYEWVIEMARAYEVLDVYSNSADNVIAAMSAVIGRDPTIDHVADIFGWLAIINGIHAQAADRLRTVLDEASEP